MIQFIPKHSNTPLFGRLASSDSSIATVIDESGRNWPPGEIAMLLIDDLAQQDLARKSGYRCSSPLSGLLGSGSTSY